MKGLWTVYRREMAQYFTSPIAYMIAAAFLLVTAAIFNINLTISVSRAAVNPAAVPISLSFFLIFLAPVLTMRLLAEEQREGTLELLLTAPVTERAIVLGKFLSAWTYYSLLLAITLIYQVILLLATTPEIGQAASAYIGIWLYGGAALAIGLLFSALTENQVVAAFLGIAALLLLWIGDAIGEVVSNIAVAQVLRNLTLQGHYVTSFAVGVVRLEDIVFYAGLITLALFLAIRAVEMRRWR
jgi:ABC-2 type transport system permease protein